ncbi:hypothetical protein M3210_04410 [Oceanobacillus luteolus]|mgnify:FL=1|uniref:Lipoprotein n=1 Tax=Oceanobacillus luteolus TaxID=1274358 RepID=A0ABW4HMX7_9BACI|nr:hypothetical protein [Oceanobacillus luteolus]
MKGNIDKTVFALTFLILASCSSSGNAVAEDHSILLKNEAEEDKGLLTEENSSFDEIEIEESILKTLASEESVVEDEYQKNAVDRLNEEEVDLLSTYSSEQIEYARVWLQLGPNQEIDELYVTHIPEGEAVNPNAESSATYTEEVVQLTGSRLVEGSVTYSSNGDGTINVYFVPSHWETNTPEGFTDEDLRIFTESIVNNTDLVYIEPGHDDEVISLIKKIRN